jgi:hypothetical protein
MLVAEAGRVEGLLLVDEVIDIVSLAPGRVENEWANALEERGCSDCAGTAFAAKRMVSLAPTRLREATIKSAMLVECFSAA